MIRGVIVHLNNEQPIVVDLWDTPKPGDQGMVCTNLRSLDGKQPIFIDRGDSVFFFPYRFIRFVEIHRDSDDMPGLPEPGAATAGSARSERADASAASPPPVAPEEDLEIDEDFLRRIREV